MTSPNHNPEQPPMPNLEELTGIHKPEQEALNLLPDDRSINMNADSFTVHSPYDSDNKVLGDAPDTISSDTVALPFGLDKQPGGRLDLVGDTYQLTSEGATLLNQSALVAGHLATRMGEDVVVNWGVTQDLDTEGRRMPERPIQQMNIGPYVRELHNDPDQMYDPRFEDFNTRTQEAYQSGRMTMPDNMNLSPGDQLIAAHAARRLIEDRDKGKFREDLPHDYRLSPEEELQELVELEELRAEHEAYERQQKKAGQGE